MSESPGGKELRSPRLSGFPRSLPRRCWLAGQPLLTSCSHQAALSSFLGLGAPELPTRSPSASKEGLDVASRQRRAENAAPSPDLPPLRCPSSASPDACVARQAPDRPLPRREGSGEAKPQPLIHQVSK